MPKLYPGGMTKSDKQFMPIQWIAHYRDNTALPQYNENGENKYTNIERGKLQAFSLLDEEQVLITVHFDHPEQRLIYRRRVFQIVGEEDPITFHMVGWQRTIHGECVQSISIVDSRSGKVDVIGAWFENHFLFDRVLLMPEEIAVNGHHNL